MRVLKEGSGVYVDFTSRTVTLIGADTIDLIFTDALGDKEVDAEDITTIALALVKQYHPEYVDDGIGRPWSLGTLEEDIDYLMTKMPSTFESVQFKSDGGRPHGAV